MYNYFSGNIIKMPRRKTPPSRALPPPSEARPFRIDPKSIARQVGQRIRRRRRAKGLSKWELEQMAGHPDGTVERCEKGVDALGASLLYDLAQALGVQVAYFFESVESTAPEPAAPAFGASPTAVQVRDMERFLKVYESITDAEVRQTLFDLLVSMAMETPDPDNG